ncbi:hypothetical protein ACLB2K_019407 [Fragaria x ananassa]
MRKTLAYVRERIRQKLEGWKAYFVSSRQGNSHKIGGHGSPILSNGNCSHAVTLCKAINSDIANFWWGYSASKLIIHFKSWDDFWKSKSAGGIGFKDLAVFNKALLAKQCWRLVKNPNSLWCHFLKGRYFENSSFVHAKKGRVLLGGSIIPIDTSNRFTPLLVAEVIDENREWQIDHLKPFLRDSDFNSIKAIPIGPASKRDVLVWPQSKSGNYTVRSGYYKTLSARVPKASIKASTSHKLILWYLWEIWKHRCEIVMDHGKPNPKVVMKKIKYTFGAWVAAQASNLNSLNLTPSQSASNDWCPPPNHVVKVNVDGSWDEQTKISGIGNVIRNHMGECLAGASLYGKYNSAIEVEADAVVWGLQLAERLRIRSIVVEGDCYEVFSAIIIGEFHLCLTKLLF